MAGRTRRELRDARRSDLRAAREVERLATKPGSMRARITARNKDAWVKTIGPDGQVSRRQVEYDELGKLDLKPNERINLVRKSEKGHIVQGAMGIPERREDESRFDYTKRSAQGIATAATETAKGVSSVGKKAARSIKPAAAFGATTGVKAGATWLGAGVATVALGPVGALGVAGYGAYKAGKAGVKYGMRYRNEKRAREDKLVESQRPTRPQAAPTFANSNGKSGQTKAETSTQQEGDI